MDACSRPKSIGLQLEEKETRDAWFGIRPKDVLIRISLIAGPAGGIWHANTVKHQSLTLLPGCVDAFVMRRGLRVSRSDSITLCFWLDWVYQLVWQCQIGTSAAVAACGLGCSNTRIHLNLASSTPCNNLYKSQAHLEPRRIRRTGVTTTSFNVLGLFQAKLAYHDSLQYS